jgi:hypothetical protein
MPWGVQISIKVGAPVATKACDKVGASAPNQIATRASQIEKRL